MSTLVSVAPESFPIGLPEQDLTATGTGFTGSSKITFDDEPQTTTLVGPTTLTCRLRAAELVAGRTIVVSVSDASQRELLYIGYGTDDASNLVEMPSDTTPDGTLTYLVNAEQGFVACIVGTVGHYE